MKRMCCNILVLFVGLLTSRVITQNWEWSNPLPTGLNYNDVIIFPDGEILIPCFAPLLLRSTDYGFSWTTQQLQDMIIWDMEILGDKLNVRAEREKRSHLYVSTDRGKSFKSIAKSLTDTLTITQFQISIDSVFLCLGHSAKRFYICKSTDNGATWKVDSCPLSRDETGFAFWNQYVGIISERDNVDGTFYLTYDGGKSWQKSDQSPVLVGSRPIALKWLNDSTIFSYTNDVNSSLLLRSTDRGKHWVISKNIAGESVSDLLKINSNRILLISRSIAKRLYISDNIGTTWSLVYQDNYSENVLSAGVTKDSLIAVAVGAYGSIVGTTDGGLNWDIMTRGVFGSWNDLHFVNPRQGVVIGQNRTDADGGQLLKTSDAGVTWKRNSVDVFQPLRIASLNPQQWWISGGVGFLQLRNAMIIYSNDSGISWTSIYDYPGIDRSINAGFDLAVVDSHTIWCATNTAIIQTTDNGKHWINRTPDFHLSGNYESKRVIFSSHETGFILWEEYGRMTGSWSLVVRTNDSGTSWDTVSLHQTFVAENGRTFGSQIIDMTASGWNNIWIATSSITTGKDSLHCSSDAGKTWRSSELPFRLSGQKRILSFLDSLHGYYLNYRTSDGGSTWKLSDTFNNIFSIGTVRTQFLNQLEGWTIGSRGAILRTTNGGIDWISSTTPHTSSFSLSQNYPNPTSSLTTIPFEITPDVASRNLIHGIKLVVYDLLGREVATIAREELDVGKNQISFDASRLQAGVYCYRLIVGEQAVTRKMVVVR